MERDRRSYYRRQQPPRRDAVFSAMLGQITVCLILLVLAYCLKLSGLPVYEAARAALENGLSKELNLGAVGVLLERFDLHIPVLQPNAEEMPANADAAPPVDEWDDADEDETEADALMDGDAAQADTTPQPQPVFDDELAAYVEQYLPKEDEAANTMADGGETPVPPVELPQSDLLGQGGGITPVSFSASVGDKKLLPPPAGTFLSPFFITQQPVLPVKLGTLTSRFGYRTHPVTGKADFHTGVDIAAPEGTPIAAVLPGTVSEVGVSDFYGNYVLVRHGSNLETLYGHCSAVLVEPGTVVRAYETIAKVGSTGMSTGNHVHLEFRVQGQKGDPAWVYDEF